MVTWNFIELGEVGSTQTIAKSLASKGAPEGTTVVAKSQSSGEGRLGRSWFSPEGGLYTSFVLRPKDLSRPELISLISAIAVVDGVKNATGLRTVVRWPNDVIASGKKLAGVISEAQSYKAEFTQVVVGIGMNCNAPMARSGELRKEATSLAEELKKDVEISEIKLSILDAFSSLYDRWQAGEEMMPVWREHLGTLGKRVNAKLKKEENLLTGIAEDVNSEGSLVIAMNGKRTTVRPEELEWLREIS